MKHLPLDDLFSIPSRRPSANAVLNDSKDQFPIRREDGTSMPAHIKDQLDALMIEVAQRRAELDILRKTRGQRNVGSLIVPVHLRAPEPISDAGVEKRGTLAAVLPAKD